MVKQDNNILQETISKNRKLDTLVSILMGILVLFVSYISTKIWGTKTEPYVEVTIGHILFLLVVLGGYGIWFLGIRKYPLTYFKINKAKKKYWYFIAPFLAPLGFAFCIPTYIMITKAFPVLGGGGFAPELNYPLIIVFLVEIIKYPLTSVIPHNIAWRGAVFNTINKNSKATFIIAFTISTAFYVIYHLFFDASFSAIYFNTVWNILAIFLLVKSDSLYPPMIFHMFINFFSIIMSWGYNTFA